MAFVNMRLTSFGQRMHPEAFGGMIWGQLVGVEDGDWTLLIGQDHVKILACEALSFSIQVRPGGFSAWAACDSRQGRKICPITGHLLDDLIATLKREALI